MFGTQATRLLRDSWKNAKSLAEELYAMFQDDIPAETSGGLTLSNTGTGAPLTIKKSAFGAQPAINFGGGSGDPNVSFGDNGGIIINGPTITLIYQNGDGTTGTTQFGSDPPPAPQTTNKITVNQGGGAPAQITGGGPGASYTANLYPAGPSGASKVISITVLQIDSGETVPAGTWVEAITVGTAPDVAYYAQVPVWL